MPDESKSDLKQVGTITVVFEIGPKLHLGQLEQDLETLTSDLDIIHRELRIIARRGDNGTGRSGFPVARSEPKT